MRKREGELSESEIKRILDSIASFSSPIIILTGGEPMAREDIFKIASYGSGIGLKMVMAVCGTFIDSESIGKIMKAGIKRISFSIDGAVKETHDSIRGVPGAFDNILKAARLSSSRGLEFQINTTVFKKNANELPRILELAVNLGAVSFHPFMLVPTGRGKNLTKLEISPEGYENILKWIYEQSGRTPILFKPTCAPHYQRILRQNRAHAAETTSLHTGVGTLDRLSRGCMGGQSFAFISHTGKVQMCGFLDVEAGALRAENYDFRKIWENSLFFRELRDVVNYKGKCGYCEYKNICGGCRARAYGVSGDYMDEEPYCVYTPAVKAGR